MATEIETETPLGELNTQARRTARASVARRAYGVAFLLVPALLIWLSVAVYQKVFTSPAWLYVRASSVGHQMHTGADVKLRGVVVGEVRSVKADGSGGATLTLAIDRGQLRHIPAGVSVTFLPTTVFGERYVDLEASQPVEGGVLRSGATIEEDRSRDAIEIQQVLAHTMTVLTAVKPAELQATLTAWATALDGKGSDLGADLDLLDTFLTDTNPHLNELVTNLRQLTVFADNLNASAPDLLQGLSDFATTAGTIAEKRQALEKLYVQVGGSADSLRRFLTANEYNLLTLPGVSRPSLDTLAHFSPELPCMLRQLAQFIPLVDLALGKGTDRQGAHATINTVPDPGRYLPGKDKPHYQGGGQPLCYSVPFRPGTGTAPRPSTTSRGLLDNLGPLGPVLAPVVGPGSPGNVGPGIGGGK